jgi:hypothetical protein
MISPCILSLSASVKVDGSCCSKTALRLGWLSLSTTRLWKFWSSLTKTSEVSGAAEIPRKFSALDRSGCEGQEQPDPYWIWSQSGQSGSRRAKMAQKSSKKSEISCFEVLDVLF